jgi:hypothetical protein
MGVERNHERMELPPRPTGWELIIGLVVAGVGTVVALVTRGCWHRHMGWPIKDETGEFSYQVCMDCGVKRLFDERTFRGYGHYNYDLQALIAEARRLKRRQEERIARRSA